MREITKLFERNERIELVLLDFDHIKTIFVPFYHARFELLIIIMLFFAITRVHAKDVEKKKNYNLILEFDV